jgi:hypothetical protein
VLGADVARGSAAAAAAVAVALAVSLIPGHGAPDAVAAAGAGTTTTDTITPTESISPTDSTTPTPTPTDTATPTPTETTPTPAPTATVPPDDRLLPDLISVPARELSIEVDGDVRRLRFTSSLGNIGAGPIEVRPNQNQPCPVGQRNSAQIVYRNADGIGLYDALTDVGSTRHRAGCMIYHPLHRHWHFKAAAQYILFSPAGNRQVVVAARRKVSFCLRDSARLPAKYGSFAFPERYLKCTRTSPQGISPGWMDVYKSFLAGQSLRLPDGLPNGLYCLTTVVDPIDQLVEADNSNNYSVRALAIHGARVALRPNARCF